MKRNILLLIISVMLAGAARGQQATDTTVVYYRQGYSVVELTLRNNRAALEGFLNRFNASMQDSTLHLVSFRLDAYASPEGTAAANDRLSENRAKRLAEYICSRTGLSESDLTIEGHGIDWEQLEEKTAASDVPYKEEVLDVLRNTPEWIYDDNNRIIDGRKHRLGMLRGGVPYNYLSEHIFPLLRRSCITLSYTVEPLEQPAEERPAEERPAAEQPEQPREEVAAQPDPAPVSTPVPAADKREFRPLLAVKTNLLYWATVMPDFKSYTFVPNLEIEYFFKERWSLSAPSIGRNGDTAEATFSEYRLTASNPAGGSRATGVSAGSIWVPTDRSATTTRRTPAWPTTAIRAGCGVRVSRWAWRFPSPTGSVWRSVPGRLPPQQRADLLARSSRLFPRLRNEGQPLGRDRHQGFPLFPLRQRFKIGCDYEKEDDI